MCAHAPVWYAKISEIAYLYKVNLESKKTEIASNAFIRLIENEVDAFL